MAAVVLSVQSRDCNVCEPAQHKSEGMSSYQVAFRSALVARLRLRLVGAFLRQMAFGTAWVAVCERRKAPKEKGTHSCS